MNHRPAGAREQIKKRLAGEPSGAWCQKYRFGPAPTFQHLLLRLDELEVRAQQPLLLQADAEAGA